MDVSTGIDVVQGSQTTLQASEVTAPLLFCILCNSACQLGEVDWSQIFKCNKSNKSKKQNNMLNPSFIVLHRDFPSEEVKIDTAGHEGLLF